jgi:hypothetical protein
MSLESAATAISLLEIVCSLDIDHLPLSSRCRSSPKLETNTDKDEVIAKHESTRTKSASIVNVEEWSKYRRPKHICPNCREAFNPLST